jgi:ribosomal protein L20
LEANSITATEAFQTYSQLICQLQERKTHKFIPSAKELLCTLKENYDVQEQKFFSSVDNFYNSSIQYLVRDRRNSFDKVSKFRWINLQTEIASSDLQESAQIINAIVKDSINFDERTLLNKVIQNQKVACGSSSEKVPDTIEEKWQAICKVFQKTEILCTNISKVVEFAMSLPGTSASVERVFSVTGNIWSAERGRLLVSTVKHLLNVKINSELSCREFYDVIKTNKPFLKKVKSSEKYS